jgi:hypothetical protein
MFVDLGLNLRFSNRRRTCSGEFFGERGGDKSKKLARHRNAVLRCNCRLSCGSPIHPYICFLKWDLEKI